MTQHSGIFLSDSGGPGVEPEILGRLAGRKKLRMASQREAEDLTGLQVGGTSALALLNRGFEVCLERAGADLAFIHISAGQRGANLRLAPADLLALTNARLVDTA